MSVCIEWFIGKDQGYLKEAEMFEWHLTSCYLLELILVAVADLMTGMYLVVVAAKDLMFRARYNEHAYYWMASWQCTATGILAMTSTEVWREVARESFKGKMFRPRVWRNYAQRQERDIWKRAFAVCLGTVEVDKKDNEICNQIRESEAKTNGDTVFTCLRVIIMNQNLSRTKVWYWICLSVVQVSVLILSFMTVERWLCISWPLRAPRLSLPLAKATLALMWLVGLLLAVGPGK